MKHSLVPLSVAAALLVGSLAGGVSASALITGAQIKNSTITGADIHSGSVPPGDLAVHPRLFRWTGHYTSDGVAIVGKATSTRSVPADSLLRSVALTYAGDVSSCVRHGNAAEPTVNTGRINAKIEAGGGQIATYVSMVRLTSTISSPPHANVGTELFTGGTTRRLTVSAFCEDVTAATADSSPMPSYSVTLTFQVTPVTVTGADAFQ